MGAATLGVFNMGTAAAGANVHDITEAGTGSITIPGGVTSVTIQVWGAGGDDLANLHRTCNLVYVT